MYLPKLVIFDCDGVLVDSEPVTEQVIAANLTRHGLPMTPERVHELFIGGTIAGAAETARRLGAELPEDWVDQMYAEMFEALARGVDLIPGVVDLLDRLEGLGVATAIASNGPVDKMQVTLPPVGLWDRFAGRIYSGHDHGAKPAPDMIWKIMADAGVGRSEAVMIDDSRTGCMAAVNAGIRCFGYVADGDPDRMEGAAIEPVRTMAQIAALIGLD